MTSSKVKNLPASVRARLLNLARERGEDFTGILTRFALERLMFRPSLDEVIDFLAGFLLPMLGLDEANAVEDGLWSPGGPWRPGPG